MTDAPYRQAVRHGNTLMDSNRARAERLVQRELEMQKYDVAPREGVLQVRRKLLRG